MAIPQDDHGRRGERPVNKTALCLHFLLFVLLALSAWAMPRGPFVLVVTHPNDPPQKAISLIAAAGGSFVGSGGLPWISLAHANSEDFPARLLRAGALLVLNASLSAACSQESLK
ncbi:hypothetical protein [Sinorhizobium terangae]|uniref:Uncharacterized protein n=1 Tax=Sinorhizobium terangae TaxID=110322 RepID=A0A6N7L5Z6_SINTE|nr:hypothetical protein [Sinorhizobium terangae]MBB4185602.1 apolipoprotein N-acyltransferase [Sinorhizobium terangae]MQX13357.1 hypothetical protein [Sinorhizobium terangae]WFU46334.1 hypothetical protein QA637_10475 [Sinorhizobium terangae]